MTKKQKGNAPTLPQKSELSNTSIIAQQQTTLEALRADQDGSTTIQLREQHNVMHPAALVMELREMGYNIVTIWDVTENAQGHKHRNARYVLLPGKYKGVAQFRAWAFVSKTLDARFPLT